MLKLNSISVVILSFILIVSCSKDESQTKLTVLTESIKLSTNETYQIEVESSAEIKYSSLNDYHATVDKNGLVKAKKVGKTEINVFNVNDTVRIAMEIEPMVTIIEEPQQSEFKIAKRDFLKTHGIADYSENNFYVYFEENFERLYEFKNDELFYIGYILYMDYYSYHDVDGFLMERYRWLEQYRDIDFYINESIYEYADLVIGTRVYDNGNVLILFEPKMRATKSSPNIQNNKLLNYLESYN